MQNAHEMIINSICGSDNNEFYTGGWDGTVKKWIIDGTSVKSLGGVNLNSCINTITVGENMTSVFAGCADGMIRKITF